MNGERSGARMRLPVGFCGLRADLGAVIRSYRRGEAGKGEPIPPKVFAAQVGISRVALSRMDSRLTSATPYDGDDADWAGRLPSLPAAAVSPCRNCRGSSMGRQPARPSLPSIRRMTASCAKIAGSSSRTRFWLMSLPRNSIAENHELIATVTSSAAVEEGAGTVHGLGRCACAPCLACQWRTDEDRGDRADPMVMSASQCDRGTYERGCTRFDKRCAGRSDRADAATASFRRWG